MWVKVPSSDGTAKVTHDMTRKSSEGMVAIRQGEVDRVWAVLATAKGQSAADTFNSLLHSAVTEANALTERNSTGE